MEIECGANEKRSCDRQVILMDKENINLRMSRDEGLILYEWLCLLDEKGVLDAENEVERKILWGLEGQLEKILVEPLEPDYKKKVEAARKRIMDS